MAAALGALERGINVSAAAKEFNVPRVTLLYKWKGKSPKRMLNGTINYFDRNGGKYSSTVDNRDFETSLSNNKRPAVRQCGVYHKRKNGKKCIYQRATGCGLCPFNVDNVNFEKVSSRNLENKQKPENIRTIGLLTELENRIGKNKVMIFKRNLNKDKWEGTAEDTSLFKIWEDLTQENIREIIIRAEEQDENERETGKNTNVEEEHETVEVNQGGECLTNENGDSHNTEATCQTICTNRLEQSFKTTLEDVINGQSPIKSTSTVVTQSFQSSDEEVWTDSGDSLDDVTISEEKEYCELDGMNNVSAGDYVLVKFFGGKRKTTQYRYVCVVQNVLHEENEIEVMSMKVSNTEKDVFRVDESDVSLVEMSAIIGKLPSPEILVIGDRVKYQFPKPVDVFEST
ncbi:hypothetical protein JTB14_019301 [Gonioctena quinquepunctata]|nr:hypothetical protein JTB14_019301 [Gonioctena quinquepunctata]